MSLALLFSVPDVSHAQRTHSSRFQSLYFQRNSWTLPYPLMDFRRKLCNVVSRRAFDKLTPKVHGARTRQINDSVRKTYPPVSVAIAETARDSSIISLTAYVRLGSRLFCLHGKWPWTRTCGLAAIASNGACVSDCRKLA